MEKDSFAELNASLILGAVESTGYIATGRFQQLSSMENRVFAVEVEDERGIRGTNSFIVKFYRPDRWNSAALVSEHALMRLLAEENIQTPALLPVLDSGLVRADTPALSSFLSLEYREGFVGEPTLGHLESFPFAVWERVVGRVPLEMKREDLVGIGKTIARMHNLFESHIIVEKFKRPRLNLESYAYMPLEKLIAWGRVPGNFQNPLFDLIESLAQGLHWVEDSCDFIPVHGDLHRLNLMQRFEGGEFWFVDFDDCMLGPEVQDLWLLASTCSLLASESRKANGQNWLGSSADVEEAGRENSKEDEREDSTTLALELLVEGYTQFRRLPLDWEKLVEPLRALRMIYYLGWIAGHWSDPFFRRTFSFFEEKDYWEKTYCDFCDQHSKLWQAGLLDNA